MSKLKTSVKKTAVIVGCSQMGARLAMSLSDKGYKVVIMDKDYHALQRIDRHFLGTEFLGDGQDLAALRSLGVDNIKLFVAATGNDAVSSYPVTQGRKKLSPGPRTQG